MHLIWLDIESTGLNPHTDKILEVAAYVAPLLDPFDTKLLLDTPVWVDKADRNNMSEYVRAMHTTNGLLDDINCGDSMRLEWVEERLLEYTQIWLDMGEEKPTLAGSSIHFDKSFIAVHMPRLDKLLSYRLFDVSAIKLEAESQGMPRIPKAEAHRANDDIQESIRHLKLVRDWHDEQFRLKAVKASLTSTW